jgi:pimeloyl-ACP methyl ester carboxylesterase
LKPAPDVRLKAPSKELVWFENAAHMVNSEERELFCKVLVEKVRAVALGGKPG